MEQQDQLDDIWFCCVEKNNLISDIRSWYFVYSEYTERGNMWTNSVRYVEDDYWMKNLVITSKVVRAIIGIS